MKLIFTKPFSRHYKKLPDSVRRKLEKQIKFLTNNLQHPSLHAKKYDEAEDVWQARVDDNYRFYFKVDNDTYIILTIMEHL